MGAGCLLACCIIRFDLGSSQLTADGDENTCIHYPWNTSSCSRDTDDETDANQAHAPNDKG